MFAHCNSVCATNVSFIRSKFLGAVTIHKWLWKNSVWMSKCCRLITKETDGYNGLARVFGENCIKIQRAKSFLIRNNTYWFHSAWYHLSRTSAELLLFTATFYAEYPRSTIIAIRMVISLDLIICKCLTYFHSEFRIYLFYFSLLKKSFMSTNIIW